MVVVKREQSMRVSVFANAIVAALVGFGGTIALIIEAAHRLKDRKSVV